MFLNEDNIRIPWIHIRIFKVSSKMILRYPDTKVLYPDIRSQRQNVLFHLTEISGYHISISGYLATEGKTWNVISGYHILVSGYPVRIQERTSHSQPHFSQLKPFLSQPHAHPLPKSTQKPHSHPKSIHPFPSLPLFTHSFHFSPNSTVHTWQNQVLEEPGLPRSNAVEETLSLRLWIFRDCLPLLHKWKPSSHPFNWERLWSQGTWTLISLPLKRLILSMCSLNWNWRTLLPLQHHIILI